MILPWPYMFVAVHIIRLDKGYIYIMTKMVHWLNMTVFIAHFVELDFLFSKGGVINLLKMKLTAEDGSCLHGSAEPI